MVKGVRTSSEAITQFGETDLEDRFRKAVIGSVLLYIPSSYRRKKGIDTLHPEGGGGRVAFTEFDGDYVLGEVTPDNPTYIMAMSRAYASELGRMVRIYSQNKPRRSGAETGQEILARITGDAVRTLNGLAKCVEESGFRRSLFFKDELHRFALYICQRTGTDVMPVTESIGELVETRLPAMLSLRGITKGQQGAAAINRTLSGEYRLFRSILAETARGLR